MLCHYFIREVEIVYISLRACSRGTSLGCRYYFKKASDEFECGAVFEEIWEDGAVLPMYEGKILGKVERMD